MIIARPKCKFTWNLDRNVLCLVDLNGEKSLTNDMEEVLHEISKTVNLMDLVSNGLLIMYKDSEGTWDGVKWDGAYGSSVDFYSLGTKDYESARHLINEINRREPERISAEERKRILDPTHYYDGNRAEGHRTIGQENLTDFIKNKKPKCICCGTELSISEFGYNEKASPEQQCWNGGDVSRIHMGYGSRLDGEIYLIALCDKCVEEKAIMIGNYL